VDGKAVDYRSGTMVNDTLKGTIEPTILSPGDVSWLSKLEHEWEAQKGGDVISAVDSPILVRTPLVVAMWQSRAAALGCWPTPGPDCTWAAARLAPPGGWATSATRTGEVRVQLRLLQESTRGRSRSPPCAPWAWARRPA
jgi:hypothetical protein